MRMLLVLSLLLLVARQALAQEAAVLKLIVNEAEYGDQIVLIDSRGDVLVPLEAFEAAGLRNPPEPAWVRESGSIYVSLARLRPKLHYQIDAGEAALVIDADGGLFLGQVIDLARQPRLSDSSSRTRAAFLNYGLSHVHGEDGAADGWSLPWEVGVSAPGWLGFSSFQHVRDASRDRAVRLMSHVTIDEEVLLRRTVIGDFAMTGGLLGSGGLFGGIGVFKRYALAPYFDRHGGIEFTGTVRSPTEAELQVNGQLVSRQRLSPGEFRIENVPVFGVSGEASLLLRDAFGNTETIAVPFYHSNRLLKPGLHEYRYGIGSTRQAFGQRSADYGRLSVLGEHRYGLSKGLTGALQFEADRKRQNVGVSVNFVPPWGADAQVVVALSRAGPNQGFAADLSHLRTGRRFSFSASLRWVSRYYSTLALAPQSDRASFSYRVQMSVRSGRLGSFSLAHRKSRFHSGGRTMNDSLFYSRRLFGDASLFLIASRFSGAARSTELFAAIQVPLGSRQSASATLQNQASERRVSATLQQYAPIGPGFGYRLRLDHADAQAGAIGGHAYVQYNGEHGAYSIDASRVAGQQQLRTQIGGSVALVADSIHFSRPIRDGFGLVRVGTLSGIPVRAGNQVVGRSDASGEVLVPDLLSYHANQISVNSGELPVNFQIDRARALVSPSLRGAVLLELPVTRVQGFVGRVFVARSGGRVAAEYWGLRLVDGDQTIEVTVGKAGEFYLENLTAGRYLVEVFQEEENCTFAMDVPTSEDMVVDLGEQSCAIP